MDGWMGATDGKPPKAAKQQRERVTPYATQMQATASRTGSTYKLHEPVSIHPGHHRGQAVVRQFSGRESTVCRERE